MHGIWVPISKLKTSIYKTLISVSVENVLKLSKPHKSKIGKCNNFMEIINHWRCLL